MSWMTPLSAEASGDILIEPASYSLGNKMFTSNNLLCCNFAYCLATLRRISTGHGSCYELSLKRAHSLHSPHVDFEHHVSSSEYLALLGTLLQKYILTQRFPWSGTSNLTTWRLLWWWRDTQRRRRARRRCEPCAPRLSRPGTRFALLSQLPPMPPRGTRYVDVLMPLGFKENQRARRSRMYRSHFCTPL